MDDLPDVFGRFGRLLTLQNVLHGGQEGLVEGIVLNLTQRQARQFEDADAPGQRFGHVLHQPELLRSGQAKQTFLLRLIALHLDIAKQHGRSLHLVEGDGRRIEHHEHGTVLIRLLLEERIVQRDILPLRKDLFEHGRLPHLTRPGDQHRLVGFRRPGRALLNASMNVCHRLISD